MRLFTAVVPPAEVLAEAFGVLDEVRAEHTGLRWTTAERAHLTLAFYGEVGDRSADRLVDRLSRVAGRYPALTLAFAGAGAFSNPRRARALWLGVRGDVELLTRLAASSAAAGRRVGLRVDDRAYRPHLTVARAKESVDLRALVDRLSGHQGREWQATELALVRSHLGSEPWYETVVSWPLARS